jgi:hypothetical protein
MQQEHAGPHSNSPVQMSSLHVVPHPGAYVDTTEAASMLGSSWFWRDGIELSAGAQD